MLNASSPSDNPVFVDYGVSGSVADQEQRRADGQLNGRLPNPSRNGNQKRQGGRTPKGPSWPTLPTPRKGATPDTDDATPRAASHDDLRQTKDPQSEVPLRENPLNLEKSYNLSLNMLGPVTPWWN